MNMTPQYKLVVQRDLWEKLFLKLVGGLRKYAVARLSRCFENECSELIVGDVRFVEALPDQMNPCRDFLVVQSTDDGEGDGMVVARPNVSSDQLVVSLKLGLGDSALGWNGSVRRNDRAVDLRIIEISDEPACDLDYGECEPTPVLDEAVASELSVFPRDIFAAGSDALVKDAVVLLLGADPLGVLIAICLARMGIRKLDVVDSEPVGEDSAGPLVPARLEDLGVSRSVAAIKKINQVAPGCIFNAFESNINQRLIKDRARNCNLIVTANQDRQTRYYASLLSSQLVKPHLDVQSVFIPSSSKTVFEATLLVPGECLVCERKVLVADGYHKNLDNAQFDETYSIREQLKILPTVPASNMDVALFTSQLWLDWLAGQLNGSMSSSDLTNSRIVNLPELS